MKIPPSILTLSFAGLFTSISAGLLLSLTALSLHAEPDTAKSSRELNID